jgi:pimeloyl-ACP methyl ester carboxylesterase
MNAGVWIVVVVVALIFVLGGGLALFAAWTARQVEKRLPPLGRFIDVDGARIHYLDTGAADSANARPTLLLVHGLAGQMRNFTHSLLDRLKGDYRVVILDRPGSGYSTRAPQASAAIAAQAETIARFAQRIGLKRPLIVGHSLGAAIALALALNHSDQVCGLALLAPAAYPPKHVPPPFGGLHIVSPFLRRLAAWTLATPLAILNRNLVLETLFGPQPVPRDFATRGGGLLNLRPSAFIGASRDLVEARAKLDDMPARYGSLKLPVGILYGAADRVLDPKAQGEALAAVVPGVDFELIEGAGHMILVASADRCAALIARVAQRVSATAAEPAVV